jgi:hypothetical protein
MAGFLGSLANTVARGAVAYGTEAQAQQDENERKAVQASILARQQARLDREDRMKMLELQGKYGYNPGGDPVDVPTDGATTELPSIQGAPKQPTTAPTPQAATPSPSEYSGASRTIGDGVESGTRARILQAIASPRGTPVVAATPDVQDAPAMQMKQPGMPVRSVTRPSFDPARSEAGVLANLRGQQAMDRQRMLEEGRNQRYADGLLTKQDIADMAAEGKQTQIDAYNQSHAADRATRVQIAGMPSRSANGAPGTGGDTPQSTASRKDLKDAMSAQIRGEHEVSTIKSDRAAALKSAATAPDSSRIINGSEADLRAAESRAAALRQRADSIRNVIPLQRAAATGVTAPGAPAAASTAPAAPTAAVTPAPAPRAAGNPQADADYAAAAAKYKAALDMGIDPTAAQQAYDATVTLLAKKHRQIP